MTLSFLAVIPGRAGCKRAMVSYEHVSLGIPYEAAQPAIFALNKPPNTWFGTPLGPAFFESVRVMWPPQSSLLQDLPWFSLAVLKGQSLLISHLPFPSMEHLPHTAWMRSPNANACFPDFPVPAHPLCPYVPLHSCALIFGDSLCPGVRFLAALGLDTSVANMPLTGVHRGALSQPAGRRKDHSTAPRFPGSRWRTKARLALPRAAMAPAMPMGASSLTEGKSQGWNHQEHDDIAMDQPACLQMLLEHRSAFHARLNSWCFWCWPQAACSKVGVCCTEANA